MTTAAEREPGWYPYPSGDTDYERYFDGTVWTDRWIRSTTLRPESTSSLSLKSKVSLAFILAGVAVAGGLVVFAGHGHMRTSEAPPAPVTTTR